MHKLIKRTFIPGSEWIYFKLYLGYNIADTILIKEISQLTRYLKNSEIIDKWFYIRYNDPDFHLRIRLHMIDSSKFGLITDCLNLYFNPYLSQHIIWNIQFDTYKRELERYSPFLIEELEYLFCINSECCVKLIPKLKLIDSNYRWKIGIYIIDKILTNCRLSLSEKEHLLNSLSDSFKIEFGFNKYNSKQFNIKYREHRNEIENILQCKNKLHLDFIECINIVNEYSLIENITFLNIINNARNNNIDILSILGSYIHMSMNRLFINNNRLYEALLYNFLYRYYCGLNVRETIN